jgi:hypothetical protein
MYRMKVVIFNESETSTILENQKAEGDDED